MIINELSLFFPVFYFILYFLTGPGQVGVFLFFSTLLVSFFFFFSRFSWVSVLVWLTYVSALLVLFLFFVSICPNSIFSISRWCLSIFWFFGFLVFYSDVFSIIPVDSCLFYCFCWVDSQGGFCLLLAVLLLFCMVGVCKISDCKMGSLRFYL